MGLLTLLACGSNPFEPKLTVEPHRAARPDVDTGGEDSPPPEDSDTAVVVDPPEVCINELMSQNVNSVGDDNGVPSDWIELHNPGAAAAELAGWTITRDDHVDALDGLTIDAGGFLLLWADDSVEVADGHLDFNLPAEGGALTLSAPDGTATTLAFGSIEPDWSAARAYDCAEDEWEFVWHGTPGSTNHPPVYVDVPLLDAGSTWRWLDTGIDPDPAWTALGFDDGAWLEGPAPIGYGDTYQVSIASYGADPNNKYVTTWFRRTLALTDVASLVSLNLSLQRDDGAVVYLNGVEVGRSNMPEGDVTSATLATASTDAETTWFAFAVDPTLLVEGDNQLAVEVHQASVSSSDLGFDLLLTGTVVEE